MRLIDRILEKSLSESILSFWFILIAAALGAIIPYLLKIGEWIGVVLGIILGLVLSIILQLVIHIHYMDHEVIEAVKSLCNKPVPMKRFFKEWIGEETRKTSNLLNGLIGGGATIKFDEPKEADLKMQLKLIGKHMESQKKATTCLQIWSDRIFPIDRHYVPNDNYTIAYLTDFERYYKKINGEKARFLLGTLNKYNQLKTSFNRWQELLDYHKKNEVDLYWVDQVAFDIAKHKLGFCLEDFCLVKANDFDWIIGRNEIGGPLFLNINSLDIKGIHNLTSQLKQDLSTEHIVKV